MLFSHILNEITTVTLEICFYSSSFSIVYPASALLSKKAASLIPDASGILLGSGPLQTQLLGVALFGWYLCGRNRGKLR